MEEDHQVSKLDKLFGIRSNANRLHDAASQSNRSEDESPLEPVFDILTSKKLIIGIVLVITCNEAFSSRIRGKPALSASIRIIAAWARVRPKEVSHDSVDQDQEASAALVWLLGVVRDLEVVVYTQEYTKHG